MAYDYDADMQELFPIKNPVPPTFSYPSMPQTPGASYGTGQGFAPISKSSNAQALEASPQATGLEQTQRAFLDAIAGPESKGKYNIRYSPKGGVYFEGFGAHPNIAEMGPDGPSTAAGRYQITKTTWDELKARKLIPADADFSPANQDKAALALAKLRYGAYTGGRDLWADLKSGGLTQEIMSTLGPTWSGFRDNPQVAMDWWNRALGGKGNPSGTGTPTGVSAQTQAPPMFSDEGYARTMAELFPVKIPAVASPAPNLPAPKLYDNSGKPTAPIAYAPEPVSWGPATQFANGLMLNKGPQINGLTEGIRYMKAAHDAGVPLGEAFKTARDQIYPQARDQWAQEQQNYTAEHPLAAPVLQGAGNMLPIMAGVGVAGAGLRGLGALAPEAVPALNFIGGVPQGLGTVGKLASGATAGAWQGAMGNAMLGENPLTGAMIGGALGAPFGWLAQTAGAPLAATASRDVADLAQRATAQGYEIPASAIINNGGMQRVVQALSGKGDEATAQAFTKGVAKLFGGDKDMAKLGASGLLPEVMDAAKARLGQGFEDFAQRAKLDVNGQLFLDLSNVSQSAHGVSPAIGKEVDRYILEVLSHSQANGQLSGKQFRYLTNSNSILDDMWKNPNTLPFARGISDAMFSGLDRAVPGATKEIRDLASQYRAFKTIEPLAEKNSTNGLLGPESAMRLARAGYDLEGQIAPLMPRLTKSGAETSGHGLGHIPRAALGLGGAVAGGTLLGNMGHLGEHALGLVAEHPFMATLAAGGALGAAKAQHAFGHYLASPAYTQRVIGNTLAPQAGAWFNPAVPIGNALAPGVQ